MENIIRKRNPLRRQFEKMDVELTELINAQSKDDDAIQAKYQLLQDTYMKIEDLDNSAFEEMLTRQVTPETEDAEMNETSQYKMKMEIMKAKMQKLTKPPPSSESTISVFNPSGDMKRLYNLPRVELKKFSGKLTDWLGFWAQFGKIHEDKGLHESDKFYYLMQSLEPGTEPHELVSGYPLSEENYQKAVSALRRRYGDDDILLQVYIRELLALVISNVNTKEKVPFKDLYLRLDSYLRSLKTLKLEKADPATWLFPLVESSLPEDVLYSWQRSALAGVDRSMDMPPKSRLDTLMEFMEKEVQIRQRIEITKNFKIEKVEVKSHGTPSQDKVVHKRTSASAMETFTPGSCIFCGKRGHQSKDCFKAQRMPYHVKIDILKKRRACYNCFENHVAKKCDGKNIKCEICGFKHHTIICRKQSRQDTGNEPNNKRQKTCETPQTTSMEAANYTDNGRISLQTLVVKIGANGKEKTVRAFLDSGSQRSYVLTETASEIGLMPKSEERVVHTLFGGNNTEEVLHQKFDIKVKGINGRYQCQMEVRNQKKICGNMPRVSTRMKDILNQLQDKGIVLTDVGEDCPPIELLIGADVYGKLLTGRVIPINNGPVAVETKLGWTLIGLVRELSFGDNLALTSLNMSVSDSDITKLWELDTIGINDPAQVITAAEREQRVKTILLSNLTRDKSGRYEVKLPWKEGFPFLPSNRANADRSLDRVTRDLIKNKLFDAYGKLFEEWESEGFIERVDPLSADQRVYYLPHRAVVKASSLTTPVRPVFNASSRSGKFPSLNDCLEKGGNYILLIPEVIMRFREKPVAFLSDIRKAFQMISVHNDDRDFLRFLWWANEKMEDVIEYRHGRVPFGAVCSPFILGAVLENHLKNLPHHQQMIGNELMKALYVDNCVYSVNTKEDYYQFRTQAVEILKKAAMDLRLWVSNIDNLEDEESVVVPVLGLQWNRKCDELFIDTSKFTQPDKFTKRTVLSTIQKIFDPIGFTCPAMLTVKLILQRSWLRKIKWDEELPIDEKKLFYAWCQSIPLLKNIRINRLLTDGGTIRSTWQLHTFTDASAVAYACSVFLRVQAEGTVSIQLIAAKSRLAPVGGTTIPRMELLGCVVGSRLAKSVKTGLEMNEIKEYLWSDSTTALCWIRRNDQWGTFVGNRTEQIRKFTNVNDWRFVPGEKNPADLPSRGCSIEKLGLTKWWEGPEWLYGPEESWPVELTSVNEEEISRERKISTVVTMTVLEKVEGRLPYATLVRITGWIRRFIHNYYTRDKSTHLKGPLQTHEIVSAEIALIRSIQKEAYSGENVNLLSSLDIIKDEQNVLRVKTQLTYGPDEFNFKYPFILPGRHQIVQQLIWDTHRAFCHAGAGFLVTYLRKKFWIVHARQSVRHVISRCYQCRRYSAKGTVTETAGLPVDRIRNGEPFEITGIDIAGPFILKNGKKIWMILYTCALYRAVHLELIDSMTTTSFIKSLGRFVNKFRRPAVVYTDNGTNFKGAVNFFRKLDWTKLLKEESVSTIEWKFNPSTASWWGGWWERLIRSVKDLLRRTLGKSQVNRKEMELILAKIEDVINGRPLTYVSEDPNDLEALTPNCFIHPFGSTRFPELEQMTGEKLRYRHEYVKTLQKELRQRWRREYLSMLVAKPQKPSRKLEIGELVVVSNDNKKRHEWDLARIVELYPGKDDISRVAKIKTAGGEYIRPVQRLHPLEMNASKCQEDEKAAVVTRAGRVVKKPTRFQ